MEKVSQPIGKKTQKPSAKTSTGAFHGPALAGPQGKHLAELTTVIDKSSVIQEQRQLNSDINNSPRVLAQLKLHQDIDNSPRMVAQRKQWEGDFGSAIQTKPEEEKLSLTHREAAPEWEDEKLLQGRFADSTTAVQREESSVSIPNRTGLPDRLKTGIETISGFSMNDVNVHYNSAKPAQLNALAYAQGTDIHVAPGQEEHLSHEAWHIVQQKQGRVQPTLQAAGVPINNDRGLEKEADRMGTKAMQLFHSGNNNSAASPANETATAAVAGDVAQLKYGFELEAPQTRVLKVTSKPSQSGITSVLNMIPGAFGSTGWQKHYDYGEQVLTKGVPFARTTQILLTPDDQQQAGAGSYLEIINSVPMNTFEEVKSAYANALETIEQLKKKADENVSYNRPSKKKRHKSKDWESVSGTGYKRVDNIPGLTVDNEGGTARYYLKGDFKLQGAHVTAGIALANLGFLNPEQDKRQEAALGKQAGLSPEARGFLKFVADYIRTIHKDQGSLGLAYNHPLKYGLAVLSRTDLHAIFMNLGSFDRQNLASEKKMKDIVVDMIADLAGVDKRAKFLTGQFWAEGKPLTNPNLTIENWIVSIPEFDKLTSDYLENTPEKESADILEGLGAFKGKKDPRATAAPWAGMPGEMPIFEIRHLSTVLGRLPGDEEKELSNVINSKQVSDQFGVLKIVQILEKNADRDRANLRKLFGNLQVIDMSGFITHQTKVIADAIIFGILPKLELLIVNKESWTPELMDKVQNYVKVEFR